jgi:hypothetical protein
LRVVDVGSCGGGKDASYNGGRTAGGDGRYVRNDVEGEREHQQKRFS